MLILACLCVLVFACSSRAQGSSDAIHEVEVLLRARGGQVGGVRVRLLRESRMLPIGETFSGQGGEVRFSNLLPGDYIVETIENESFEATVTRVSIVVAEGGFGKPMPRRFSVTVDLPVRKQPGPGAPGVVMADVDLKVPEAALRHYRKGSEALRAGKKTDAVKELKAAVEAYPNYYAARLDLGRELRAEKLFPEAEDMLKPLGKIAPTHPEPLVEYAMVLLALGRAKEAASQLRKALEMEEANWATHLYLGWALLETEPAEAERHFARALELDERKAAQAHLSLARLAHSRRDRQEAVRHLEAYLALAPDAADADVVRKLLAQLRK